ncbi:EF hand [Cooperia oncophora]
MIESFRENGLNAMPIHTQIKTSRIELLLTTIYHNLNKRLVSSQHIDTDKSISLLLSFLLGTYDNHEVVDEIGVISIERSLCQATNRPIDSVFDKNSFGDNMRRKTSGQVEEFLTFRYVLSNFGFVWLFGIRSIY